MKYTTFKKISILAIIATSVLLVLAARPAFAQESPDNPTDNEPVQSQVTTDTRQRVTTVNERRDQLIEQRKEVAKERLESAKLKVCNQREDNINKIMTRVVERSQRHIDRITQIADNAKAFYVKKSIVLESYDVLVADADAKKLLAQQAVDALDTTAEFSCESDGPQADIQSFRNQRITKIEAIGDYRDAVKALLVGIKSVQGPESSQEGQN